MEGPFASLPEDCISEILSLTSPLDVIRSSAVSKGFKSAADSDTIWEKFLPSDHHGIISRSRSSVDYSNKKELYFSLCDHPLLLDEGAMSFSVDKRSGKNCCLVGARKLGVIMGREFRAWNRPDSRFSEVIQVYGGVSWLCIRGIKAEILSPGTVYAAFLVFKIAERSFGLESTITIIRFVNHKSDGNAERRATFIHLELGEASTNPPKYTGELPQRRADGWMEIEIGNFYNDQGDEDQLKARLIELITFLGDSGLIIEGIEFRPHCTQ